MVTTHLPVERLQPLRGSTPSVTLVDGEVESVHLPREHFQASDPVPSEQAPADGGFFGKLADLVNRGNLAVRMGIATAVLPLSGFLGLVSVVGAHDPTPAKTDLPPHTVVVDSPAAEPNVVSGSNGTLVVIEDPPAPTTTTVAPTTTTTVPAPKFSTAVQQALDRLEVPADRVNPQTENFLTGAHAINDIGQWDLASNQMKVSLYSLVQETVASPQMKEQMARDSLQMEAFYQQWGSELSQNTPEALRSAAQDFAARKALGEHFHLNGSVFLGASPEADWLNLKFPEGPNAVNQEVVRRVTTLAVQSGRFHDWSVPVPHGRPAIEATFGKPGSSRNLEYHEIGMGIGGRTERVPVNSRISHLMRAAFEEVHARGLQGEIRSFGGLYNPRPKRGGSEYSTHAWAISMDVNSAEYPLGTPPSVTDHGHHQLAEIFERYGFVQLDHDAHHFQYATGY